MIPMPDATDLAATLSRRADEVMAEARERAGQGETVHDAIVGLWAVEDVQPIAAALERGAAASSYRSEAGDSFDRLAMALMESIERGEDQLIQLERIGNACNDVDNWDDEAEALWVRAKAAAAKNAADRERGAAAEAVIALGRQLNAPLHLVPDAGQLMRDYDAALAAYRALTEGETTDG